MNWKVKAVLVKLENTALYFTVGLLLGRYLSWWQLFVLFFPFMVLAAAYELINYKKFVIEFPGPEVSERDAFLTALDTCFNIMLWFLMGFNVAKWVWGP
jgi:hypothetical protein